MRNNYDQADVCRMIDHLVDGAVAEFRPDRPLNVVGILTRGEVLAQRIIQHLGNRGFGQIGHGVLDVTFYRDDLSEVGPRPMIRPTSLDIVIDRIPLLLVDDVLFTGRSVRAAMDALSDFGRPSAIRLAVLVDRGGRELPIQPDFVGLTLSDVPVDHRVKVRLAEMDDADEVLVGPK